MSNSHLSFFHIDCYIEENKGFVVQIKLGLFFSNVMIISLRSFSTW